MKNLAAHTEVGTNYPAYISVNESMSTVGITVRSHGHDMVCGDTAMILMSIDEYEKLVKEMCKRIHE